MSTIAAAKLPEENWINAFAYCARAGDHARCRGHIDSLMAHGAWRQPGYNSDPPLLHALARRPCGNRAHAAKLLIFNMLRSCPSFDIDQEHYGSTALHGCAHYGNEALAKALILAGANVNAIKSTQARSTPLHLACEHGHIGIAYFLLRHGAHASTLDSEGITPFQKVRKSEHLQSLMEYRALCERATLSDSIADAGLRQIQNRRL